MARNRAPKSPIVHGQIRSSIGGGNAHTGDRGHRTFGHGVAGRVESAVAQPSAMTDAPIPGRDFVFEGQARFDALANYRVTLKSTSAGKEPVEVRYGYRKPGFVRMDFIRPHAGATLVYSPETGKVMLWPFGFDTFPRLMLNPDSRMILSPQGHRVDQSDIGTLLVNVRELQRHGDTQVVGDERIGTRSASHVVVTCRPGHTVTGVSRYELWFDAGHGLPVKVASERASGQPIETVLLEDLRIDLPESQLEPFG